MISAEAARDAEVHLGLRAREAEELEEHADGGPVALGRVDREQIVEGRATEAGRAELLLHQRLDEHGLGIGGRGERLLARGGDRPVDVVRGEVRRDQAALREGRGAGVLRGEGARPGEVEPAAAVGAEGRDPPGHRQLVGGDLGRAGDAIEQARRTRRLGVVAAGDHPQHRGRQRLLRRERVAADERLLQRGPQHGDAAGRDDGRRRGLRGGGRLGRGRGRRGRALLPGGSRLRSRSRGKPAVRGRGVRLVAAGAVLGLARGRGGVSVRDRGRCGRGRQRQLAQVRGGGERQRLALLVAEAHAHAAVVADGRAANLDGDEVIARRRFDAGGHAVEHEVGVDVLARGDVGAVPDQAGGAARGQVHDDGPGAGHRDARGEVGAALGARVDVEVEGDAARGRRGGQDAAPRDVVDPPRVAGARVAPALASGLRPLAAQQAAAGVLEGPENGERLDHPVEVRRRVVGDRAHARPRAAGGRGHEAEAEPAGVVRERRAGGSEGGEAVAHAAERGAIVERRGDDQRGQGVVAAAARSAEELIGHLVRGRRGPAGAGGLLSTRGGQPGEGSAGDCRGREEPRDRPADAAGSAAGAAGGGGRALRRSRLHACCRSRCLA